MCTCHRDAATVELFSDTPVPVVSLAPSSLSDRSSGRQPIANKFVSQGNNPFDYAKTHDQCPVT